MLDVERWAELRREHFVRGVAIKELARRTGLSRNTVRAALRSDRPPVFRCPERPSKVGPACQRCTVLTSTLDDVGELLERQPRARNRGPEVLVLQTLSLPKGRGFPGS